MAALLSPPPPPPPRNVEEKGENECKGGGSHDDRPAETASEITSNCGQPCRKDQEDNQEYAFTTGQLVKREQCRAEGG